MQFSEPDQELDQELVPFQPDLSTIGPESDPILIYVHVCKVCQGLVNVEGIKGDGWDASEDPSMHVICYRQSTLKALYMLFHTITDPTKPWSGLPLEIWQKIAVYAL